MATVIESFLIKLGLDPTEFESGRKEVDRGIEKTKEHSEAAAKAIERAGEKAAEFFREMRREAIAMLAVFTAGMGIKEFIGYTIESSASLGRMAANTGMSTEALWAWDQAAQGAGGSAGGAQQAIARLSNDFAMFSLTGQSTMLPLLHEIGVGIEFNADKTVNWSKLLMDLSVWANSGQVSRPQAKAVLTQFLGDPGTVDLLLQKVPQVQSAITRFLGIATTSKQAEDAERIEKAWKTLTTTLESFARNAVLSVFGDDLTNLIDKTQKWLDKNGPWLRGEINEKLEEGVKWVKEFTKYLVENGQTILTITKYAVEFLALWKGLQFLEVLLNIAKMTGLLRLLPMALGGALTLEALQALLAGYGLHISGISGGTEPGYGPGSDRAARGPQERQTEEFPGEGSDENRRARSSIAWWMAHGLSRDKAAAIASQEKNESDFGQSMTIDKGKPTARDAGLFQWSIERLNWLHAHGFPDIEHQSIPRQREAALFEMSTPGSPGYAGGQEFLRGPDEAGQGSEILTRKYEIPRDMESEVSSRRIIAERYKTLPPFYPSPNYQGWPVPFDIGVGGLGGDLPLPNPLLPGQQTGARGNPNAAPRTAPPIPPAGPALQMPSFSPTGVSSLGGRGGTQFANNFRDIHIYTMAKDGQGIVDDLNTHLQKLAFASAQTLNTGLV